MNPNQDRHRNLYSDPLAVLLWWYDLAIFALMFPSNSVILFLRKNMGYRLLRPWILGMVSLFLLSLSGLASALSSLSSPLARANYPSGAGDVAGPSNGPAHAVLAFVVLMGILAWIHRSRAWDLVFRDSDPVHTMSRGDSFLAKPLGRLPRLSLPIFSFTTWTFRMHPVLPVPEWVVQRYIEPLLLMGLGLVLMFKMQWGVLGGWLFVAGVALAAIEALVIEQSVNTFLDLGDDKIAARFVKELSAAPTGNGQAPPAKIGGLVSASPEMMRLRAQRLAEEPNAAPANRPADGPADPSGPPRSNGNGPEPPALPEEEREWDVREERYRTRSSAESESARRNAGGRRGTFPRRQKTANATKPPETAPGPAPDQERPGFTLSKSARRMALQTTELTTERTLYGKFKSRYFCETVIHRRLGQGYRTSGKRPTKADDGR